MRSFSFSPQARPWLAGVLLIGLTLAAPGVLGAPGAPILRLNEVYRRAAPAIVGIRCQGRFEGQPVSFFGTGAIVEASGLVLTSTTVVPPGASQVRVFLAGGKVVDADPLSAVEPMEFSLIRLRAPGPYPKLSLGDSAGVRLGEASLSLGNAFLSIEHDDKVSLAAGVVSGLYDLKRARGQARYVGQVIETTAAINDAMDGGPLLNAEGEVIGLISLNYATERWLGTAIPINLLKPLFGEHRPWHSDRARPGAAILGLELSETLAPSGGKEQRRVRVDRVFDPSPAAAAGIRAGDVILSVGDKGLSSIADYLSAVSAPAGSRGLRLEVLSAEGGEARAIAVRPWRAF